MKLGEFYQLIRQCACGSGLVSDWCKDERGADIKICDRCKPGVLHKIFVEKYMDLFEEWLGSLFSPDASPGYEWVWADLLKEKGCEQVIGLEEAKRRRDGRILISCPNGQSLSSELEDKSVHILIPVKYADEVLKQGKMI